MSPAATPAAWKRLGELLTRRRVELDVRYQNRTTFTDERGLDYRLAYDIEEARRTNFRKGTLAGIANAYAVTADSLLAVLRDAHAQLEPVESPVPQAPAARGAGAPEDGEAERVIRLLIEAIDRDRPALREAMRRAMVLQDGNGGPLPLPERARLMLVVLEPVFEPPSAGRGNGTTGLPPSA